VKNPPTATVTILSSRRADRQLAVVAAVNKKPTQISLLTHFYVHDLQFPITQMEAYEKKSKLMLMMIDRRTPLLGFFVGWLTCWLACLLVIDFSESHDKQTRERKRL